MSERKLDSQIFQIIDDMGEYISGCKSKMFSSDEIICSRDRLDEYLRDLKRKAPDEIERYRKIIHNREAILEEARNTAQSLINKTMAQTDEMLSQNEIMRRAQDQSDEVMLLAQEQAQAIVDSAVMEANSLRQAATEYMEDVMTYLENLLASTAKSTSAQYDSLISTLNSYSEKVQADHKQLHPEARSEEPTVDTAEEPIIDTSVFDDEAN